MLSTIQEDDDEDDIGIEEHAELMLDLSDEKEANPYARWAREARQYIHLILLHWHSIYALTNPDQNVGLHMQDFLSRLVVDVVNMQSKEQDTRMDDLMPCILSNPIAATRPDAEKLIKQWLHSMEIENEFHRAKVFHSTYHCETILLSLQLLKEACQKDIRYLDCLETREHKIDKEYLQSLGNLTQWWSFRKDAAHHVQPSLLP